MNRIRAFLAGRLGRLLVHDGITAIAAAAAVVEGSNSLTEGVLKAAGVAGLHAGMRQVLPAPGKTTPTELALAGSLRRLLTKKGMPGYLVTVAQDWLTERG